LTASQRRFFCADAGAAQSIYPLPVITDAVVGMLLGQRRRELGYAKKSVVDMSHNSNARQGKKRSPTSLAAPVLLLGSLFLSAHAQQPGQQDFQTFCAPCHTIGSGRLIGPDLAGVGERRSAEWITEFVTSSQSMVARGDPDATALVAEYANLVMPDAPLGAAQIADVVAYMVAAGTGVTAGGATPPAQPVTPPTATGTVAAVAGDPTLGQALFDGRARLENGGPSCNACHDVAASEVLAGGSLSVDLTTAITRLSGPGIDAMLAQPPFPVMQAAYAERAITADERRALTAFLARIAAETATPTNHGFRLVLGGTTGAAALFGLFSFVWRGRKRASVNQDVFDRQGHATWED